jgi:hypothetical protein
MGDYWQINLRHAVEEFTRKQLPVLAASRKL